MSKDFEFYSQASALYPWKIPLNWAWIWFSYNSGVTLFLSPLFPTITAQNQDPSERKIAQRTRSCENLTNRKRHLLQLRRYCQLNARRADLTFYSWLLVLKWRKKIQTNQQILFLPEICNYMCFLKLMSPEMTCHIHLLNPEKENLHAILMQHYLSFDWPGTEMTCKWVLPHLSLQKKPSFPSQEL